MSDTAHAGTNGAPEAAPAEPEREEASELVARLRAIEEQPLETRAEALAQLHDELRSMLEAGDARPHA